MTSVLNPVLKHSVMVVAVTYTGSFVSLMGTVDLLGQSVFTSASRLYESTLSLSSGSLARGLTIFSLAMILMQLSSIVFHFKTDRTNHSKLKRKSRSAIVFWRVSSISRVHI